MTDDGRGSIGRQAILVGDQSSTTTPIMSVIENEPEVDMLRRKLAICHDLSKHVWQDNAKRNFRLLKQIHEITRAS